MEKAFHNVLIFVFVEKQFPLYASELDCLFLKEWIAKKKFVSSAKC